MNLRKETVDINHASTAIGNYADLRICAPVGSFTEEYVKKMKIPFRPTE
jgi:hypothetical protein